MIQVMLPQPLTAFPRSTESSAQTTPAKLMAATSTPKAVMIRSGLMERLVIPSIANASIFDNG